MRSNPLQAERSSAHLAVPCDHAVALPTWSLLRPSRRTAADCGSAAPSRPFAVRRVLGCVIGARAMTDIELKRRSPGIAASGRLGPVRRCHRSRKRADGSRGDRPRRDPVRQWAQWSEILSTGFVDTPTYCSGASSALRMSADDARLEMLTSVRCWRSPAAEAAVCRAQLYGLLPECPRIAEARGSYRQIRRCRPSGGGCRSPSTRADVDGVQGLIDVHELSNDRVPSSECLHLL